MQVKFIYQLAVVIFFVTQIGFGQSSTGNGTEPWPNVTLSIFNRQPGAHVWVGVGDEAFTRYTSYCKRNLFMQAFGR